MSIRVITALGLAACLATSLMGQVPYDPAAEQLVLFAGEPGPCGGGASDESTPPCYLFAVMDADGSHLIFFPSPGDRPRWSPDGRSIVGGLDGEIFVVTLPGGTRINLTNDPATDSTPAWSPDGAKIAFSSDRHGGAADLYLMNPDGSGVMRILTGTGMAWAPSWSADSKRIAFNCADSPSSPSDICAINADGSDFVRLTTDPANDSDPAWSRDGATILFATTRFGDSELVTMNSTDGSAVTRLSPGTLAYSPDWSLDGTRIAFDSVGESPYGFWAPRVIFVMNADGTDLTEPGWGYSAAWRPMTGVGVNNRPAASFTYMCTDVTCTFDGSVSSDSDGTIASYGWRLGDGTTSSDAITTHTFAGGKVYYIQLVVMDNAGALADVSQSVDLNKPPTASFTHTCTGLTCTFDGSASYDPDGSISYFSWSFGPGSAAGQTATHTYASAGAYLVTLTVLDSGGKLGNHSETINVGNVPPVASFTSSCNGLACTFDGSGSSDADGTVTSYQWSFGDGTTGSGPTSTHTYTAAGNYTITLTVTDNGGATGAQSKTLNIVNTPPVASFTSICSLRTCTFDGSGSSDADGTVAAYAWNFGDSAAGSGQMTTHTYASPGDYSVALTVTDNAGGTGTQSKTVTIVNASPSSSFSFTCSNRTCTFDGSGSSDPDGTIATYIWTFGDGTTGSGQPTTHTYTAPGNYSVTLTVTDNDGATGTESKMVNIVNAPPTATFTFSCSGLRCDFDGSGSSDADGTIASYAWTFGDGTTASSQTTAHTYPASGSYIVTLTVTDNDGAVGTESAPVSVVNIPPTASFSFSCSSLTCNFDGSSSSDADGSVASYAWNFGDGTVGSGQITTHTYTASGSYTVTLTVTDNAGATGTTTHGVTVIQPEVHVGDLDGSTQSVRNTWNAFVSVTVHDKSHNAVANATVSGSWSSGATATCTTSSIGKCSVSLLAIPNKTASVTFTVNTVTYTTSIYRPANNHDPDGDSNGSTITVKKP